MNGLDTGPAAGLLVLFLLAGAAPLPTLAQDVPMDRGDAPFPPREAFRIVMGASMGSAWFRDYSLTVRGGRWTAEAGLRAMPLATGMPGTRLDRPMGFVRLSWAFRVAKD